MEKVSFDPTSYPAFGIIVGIEPPTDGVVVLDAKRDLYSACKREWLKEGGLNKLDPAITTIGGQTRPSGGQVPTFYTQSAKWKYRPYEADHDLIIVGNYESESGSLTVPTLGDFTVSVSIITDVGGGLTTEQSNQLNEVWTLHGLDPDNPLIVTLSQRIAGNIIQMITGDGTTTGTITRQ